MGSKTKFRDGLRDLYLPLVVVEATAACDEVVIEFAGCRWVELLRSAVCDVIVSRRNGGRDNGGAWGAMSGPSVGLSWSSRTLSSSSNTDSIELGSEALGDVDATSVTRSTGPHTEPEALIGGDALTGATSTLEEVASFANRGDGVDVAPLSPRASGSFVGYNVRLEPWSGLFNLQPDVLEEMLFTAVETSQLSQKPVKGKRKRSHPTAYKAYRDELDRVLFPKSFEFFNQPVLIVVAAHVGEPDIPLAFSVRFNEVDQALPRPYREGILESAAPVVYVLLQRKSHAGDEAVAPRALSQARAAFGPTAVQLVVLPWRNADKKPESSKLDSNSREYQTLNLFAKEMVTSLLGERLSIVTEEVSGHVDRAKKGVKNALKSWFKTPEKNRSGVVLNESIDGSPTFLSTSTESRVRHLADLLFIQGDYEQSLAHYRLVGPDFKALKANLHYGSAMEMIGVCLILLNGSSREISMSLEAAMESFARAGDRLLVSRSLMILVDYFLYLNMVELASSALLRGISAISSALQGGKTSREWFVNVAVFLEKASGCFAARFPSKIRKAALYSFFAAERYGSAGLHEHSLECYKDTLLFTSESNFDVVEDFVYSSIAKVCVRLSKWDEARHYFAKCLRSTRQPIKYQTDIASQFLAADIHATGNNPIEFPELEHQTVSIIAPDDEPLESSECDSWKILEDEALEYAESISPLRGCSSMADHRRPRSVLDAAFAKTTEHRPCGMLMTGEVFSVVFTVRNTLKIPLVLCSFGVEFQWEHDLAVDSGDELEDDQGGGGFETFDHENVVLDQHSKVQVTLSVRPSKAGDARLVALRWSFFLLGEENESQHACPCRVEIRRNGQRLNSTRKERCSPVPLYGPENSLRVRVCKGGSRITVRLNSNVSSYVREGQQWVGSVDVLNQGSSPVRSIHVTNGTPSSIFFDPDSCEISEKRNRSFRCNLTIVEGESFCHPCWLRATSGNSDGISNLVRVVFFYKVDLVDGKGRDLGQVWRIARLRHTVEVKPCIVAFPRFLRSNPFIQGRSREFILGVEIEHSWTEGGETYRIVELGVSASSCWKVTGLCTPSYPSVLSEEEVAKIRNSPVQLRVNETATLFLTLRRNFSEDSLAEGTGTSRIPMGKPETSSLDRSYELASKQFLLAAYPNRAVELAPASVLVRWSHPLSKSHGELYLPPLEPSDWIEEDLEEEKPPKPRHVVPTIHVSFEHDRDIVHSFKNDPFLAVPVTVVLKNISEPGTVVDAKLSVIPAEIADHRRGRFWNGETSARVRHLAPLAERRIHLFAVVASPGEYCLSDVNLEPVTLSSGSGYVHDANSTVFAEVEDSFLVARGTSS